MTQAANNGASKGPNVRYRSIAILLALAASLFAMIYFGGTTSKVVEAKDLVNDIPPRSTAFENIHIFANELAELPPADRTEYLNRHRPRLSTELTYFLRRENRLREDQKVTGVEFLFGSVERTQVDDNQGNKHNGYFKDQLVARVSVEGRAEKMDVIVQCLNGWFSLPGQLEGLQTLGTTVPVDRFRIGKGEGLIHHVGFLVAIDLAEKHHIPVYRTKNMAEANRLTYAEARALEHQTDVIQVTARVFPGDEFDLVTGRFKPSASRTIR